MDCYLAQIIMAARNSDGEETGWIRILVIVIVAVFWIVSGIVKARANKLSREGEEQPEDGKGGDKALREKPYWTAQQQPVGRAVRTQPRPPRKEVARRWPAVQKFAAEAKQAFQLQTFESPKASKLSPPVPQLQPDLQELPEFTSKTIEEPRDKSISIPAKAFQEPVPAQPQVQTEYLPEVLSDYADPKALRIAILHCEILGKPLALRGPSEHIIGL